MNKKISEPEESLTISEIHELESKYDFTMPNNLKELYMKYNGGVLEISDDYYELSSIKYGINTIEDTVLSLQISEKLISREYLPFANTGVGHLVCINIDEGDNYGKIYLFRHDELVPILYNETLEDFLEVKSIDDL